MKVLLRLLVVVGLLVGSSATTVLHAQETPRCFDVPGIQHCISGRFRQYWEQNGGLAVFGYPITAARNERNRDTGRTYLTQWFERNRFELHSDIEPPYDVLLGRLGDDKLRRQGINWETLPREGGAKSNCLWFAQTGHNVCDQAADLGFKSYWQANGLADARLSRYGRSLALFGFPITGAFMETNSSGDRVLTQWFERARLEWHPNNPNTFKVLLGRLGNELQVATPNPAPSPSPRPSPSPSPSAAPKRRDPGKSYPAGGDPSHGLGGGIYIPDANFAGKSGDRPTATYSDKIYFEINVWDPEKGNNDGDGIKEVRITIDPLDDDLDIKVHERTEENPAYCPFGDDGRNTVCNEWVFAEHNNKWPDNQNTIEPGLYEVTAIIRRDGKDDVFWFFTFEIAQR